MPWHHFMSPAALWAKQPSFVVGQLLFISAALLALFHAWREHAQGRGRGHLLIWLGALIAGTGNDLIFMALPMVDNFWHAQANVMITSRLPLYIPCVYVCFMYYPTVAVRRLRMPSGVWYGLPQAALTGLGAVVFYAPYDITGAKFLWWTWHDTDLTIANRLLGAPVSSSLWVLTFSATFAWLVDRIIRRYPSVGARAFIVGLLVLGCLTSVAMVVQMTVLQQLDPLLGLKGTPGYAALAAGLVLYVLLAWRGWAAAKPQPSVPNDRWVYGMLVAHFLTFCAIVAVADPASHQSTGVHQTVGSCYVEVRDITGLTRHRFLCANDFHEDFSFECASVPPDGARWYTLCGRPHANRSLWLGAIGLLGAAGIAVFSFLFGAGPFRRRRAVGVARDQ